jgi:hypothetical protein
MQEDFALLRLSDEPGPNPQEAKHVMTAASVCFSFHGLAEKLGTTTLSIHAPVPGFEEQLEKLLNRTFTALQVGACLPLQLTSSSSSSSSSSCYPIKP